MKYFKWQQGRGQSSKPYKKICIWNFRIWKWGFDGYILKYQVNTRLDWHIDPIANGSHYRCNFTLSGNSVFYLAFPEEVIKRYEHPVWFRPDIQRHMLVVGNQGVIKLSIGFVKYK